MTLKILNSIVTLFFLLIVHLILIKYRLYLPFLIYRNLTLCRKFIQMYLAPKINKQVRSVSIINYGN